MGRHIQHSTATVWYPRVLALVVAAVVALASWGLVKLFVGHDGGTDTVTAASDDAAAVSATTGGPVATTSVAKGEDAAAEPAAGGSCRVLQVWADHHVADALAGAAQRAGDECTTFVVTPKSTAAASALVERGGGMPAAWVPETGLAPARLTEAGAQLKVGEVLASSPVVLAGKADVVGEIARRGGLGKEPTWAQLAKLQSDPVLRTGDPRSDGAAATLLLSAVKGLGGPTNEKVGALTVTLAQSMLQGDPLEAVDSGEAKIVATTQAAVAGRADYLAITPKGGAGDVQYPLVTFPDAQRSAAEKKAIERLTEELVSEETTTDVESAGLTPGAAGTPVDPAAAIMLGEKFAKLAPTPWILAVLDISGSMGEPVAALDGGLRVDLMREAAVEALGTIPATTGIGLWEFSSGLQGKQDWVDVLPVLPLSTPTGDVTHRDRLVREANRLTQQATGNETGLYDTIYAAYMAQQEGYTKGTVPSVLLLTDGNNEDDTGGLSIDELVARLKAESDPKRPIKLVLVGIGSDVELGPLEQVAAAVGGDAFVVKDETSLPEILVQVVAERAG